jgi:citrate/tricarballylate utilization protein
VPHADPTREAERLMIICNACRYCEGHCAVFPAMEKRLSFSPPDLRYLANLCHGCGSCYHHCQYAPPHEFAVDVPRTFAALRLESYRRYAWPRALGALFERSPLATALAVAAGIVAALLLAVALAGPASLVAPHGQGRFYDIVPHGVMVGAFAAAALYALAASVAAFARGWRDAGEGPLSALRAAHVARATGDALRLRYLDGGGDGCTYPGEAPSKARRWFHHLTFYGFLLCIASTSSAAVYHAFGRIAPHAWWSAPVVLGVLGGLGLLVGPAGLLALKAQSDPPARRAERGLDAAFAVLLLAASATGFALLAFRATPAMGLLLVVHLGIVLALFVTLPYGKFIHAVHRFAALLRWAIEGSRSPPPGAEPEV